METATIQIKVSPEMVTRYGQQALTERLEQLLAWEELSFQARAIKKALDDAGLDWEEARQKAWDEYKHKIKDKLPPEAF